MTLQSVPEDRPPPSPPSVQEDPGLSCPQCQRRCINERGLGVHRRYAHPEVVNEEIVVPSTKARWSEEEARAEAEATITGFKFMNLHLVSTMEGRTQESIKGYRRKKDYKEMVTTFIADLRAAPSARPESPPLKEDPDPLVSPAARSGAVSVSQSPAPLDSPSSPGEPYYPSGPRRSSSLGSSICGAVQGLINTARERGSHDYQMNLLIKIAQDALNGELDTSHLWDWYHAAIPPPEGASEQRREGRPTPPRSRRRRGRPPTVKMKRRAEYARVQMSWKKNPSRAAKSIIEGTVVVARSLEELTEYWEKVFGEQSTPYEVPEEHAQTDRVLSFIWDPVSSEEVLDTRSSPSSAPGLDAVHPRQWDAIPPSVRALFFNVVLLTGSMPRELLESRMYRLYPKEDGSRRPLQGIRQLEPQRVGNNHSTAWSPNTIRQVRDQAIRGRLHSASKWGEDFSPLLFNLVSDKIIEAVPWDVGFRLEGHG